MIRIYRYSEDERTFLLVDGRNVEIPRFRNAAQIHALCLLHQTDGIAVIDSSESADYELECYDSFGKSIMDASAARCSVAFADLLGVKAFHSQDYTFMSEGGIHKAFISSHLGECKTVSLDGGHPEDTICLGEAE